MSRDLSSTNTAQAAAASGNDFEVFGVPDLWRLIYKISSQNSASMFSVKFSTQLSAIQFSWKVGTAISECVVAIPPNESPELYETANSVAVLVDDDVKITGNETTLACLCMARSASAGFDKRTYTMKTSTGRSIVIAMTREGNAIAMSAALCAF